MAQVDDVRAIVWDKPQYDRALATGDAVTTDYELPNAPVLTGTAVVRVDGAVKSTPADYTIDESVGLVTFTAAPGNGAQVVITYKHTILSNADIDTYLSLQPDTRLAAAMALDTMASSEALVQKVITILGLSTNGAATAKALRDHAKNLRDAAVVDVIGTEDAGFDIAEWVHEPFGWTERAIKELQRESE